MADDGGGFARLAGELDAIRAGLRERELDGWLLYDLHARNAVAGGLLGLDELSRRYFVWLPAEGEPCALVHGIEQAPWKGWPWDRRSYVGWRELDAALSRLLGKKSRLAMEVSDGDAVPFIDLVPAGVVELVERNGPEVVSSADLVTRFYARWSAEEADSHRRASRVVAEVADAAFRRIAEAVEADGEVGERTAHGWVIDGLRKRGCGVEPDCIVAGGRSAANPHHDSAGSDSPLRRGDVVMIDLWGKEAPDAIFADQTWMAVLDERVPERAAELFAAVRDARDAAVSRLRDAWDEGRAVAGYELDDAARRVIAEHGHGDAFIHRTGHSIDRVLHGMGPNIDNLETHETRTLIPGVGFSIEPGIYVPGEIGLRSEINVYMAEDGPEVTTPDPQTEIRTLVGP